MNSIENQIVEKIQGEIVKAETAAERNPLINDLSAFLGIVEKRVALALPTETAVVTDAEGLVAKLNAAGEEAVAKVKALL